MPQPPQTRHSEHADPHEQYNPVPRVMIGLVLALVVWAIGYIVLARPDGMAGLGDQRDPVALAPSEAGAAGAAINASQLFVAKCQACHQASGQGLPGVFPPLAGASWVTGMPEAPLQIVLHGMNGTIDVDGTTYNGAMPAFGEQMNDAEIAALMTYIRSQWGNDSAPVDAAGVQAAREASAGRTEPWNGAAELLAFLGAGAPPVVPVIKK
ncbi:cytochrome c [Hydrogenophaga sp.]|uniref:cytochrome c n=1 Tax=Hydrogenophaga sp. TaxID=1904254 RepID=UPI00095D64C1|nr:MAG: cytochrome C oxidase Cbb3 [Burkholderiales bacterium 64-34]